MDFHSACQRVDWCVFVAAKNYFGNLAYDLKEEPWRCLNQNDIHTTLLKMGCHAAIGVFTGYQYIDLIAAAK